MGDGRKREEDSGFRFLVCGLFDCAWGAEVEWYNCCSRSWTPDDSLERWTVLKYLYIALGGALGSMARYWVGSAVGGRMGTRIPYGTFVVNLTACVLIGFSLTYLARRTGVNPAIRFLIPIGFIGAYSTFSTYEWETLSTLRTGAFLMAAAYVFGSLILGLASVWCGARLAEFVS